MRVAVDGTRFVFLHNTDPRKAIKGNVRLLPGKMNTPTQPMYNINQHGEKVLINANNNTEKQTLTLAPIEVTYELPALGSKVLVIPAGKSAKQGKWWLETTTEPRRPSKVPAAIRIVSAQKMEDNFAKAD